MALRDVHEEGIDGKVVRSAEGVRIGTGPSLEKTLLLSPWRWSERLTSFFLSFTICVVSLDVFGFTAFVLLLGSLL